MYDLIRSKILKELPVSLAMLIDTDQENKGKRRMIEINAPEEAN